jgi:hypothetical protein
MGIFGYYVGKVVRPGRGGAVSSSTEYLAVAARVGDELEPQRHVLSSRTST